MKSPPLIRWRAALAEPLTDCHPVLARVLAARGITCAEELDPSLSGLPRPELADIEAAVTRLVRAREAGEKILVVGDFDADGATSVALAVRGLRALGYVGTEYLVPNRFEYGYGLTPELVAAAAECHPDLIVTVDNGVSSHEGIAAAAARGIETVVTDHHLPSADLPQAVAVVNPNRADCPFPCKDLAGVGVMFYLLIALRARLLERGDFHGEAPTLAGLLDLVALGTIADLVKLDRTNRILVEQGLRRIRAGRASPGIQALLTIARRDPASVSAGDLSYAVAPRLNAAGRMADMTLGVETLLAESPTRAQEAATRLNELNEERRQVEGQMRAQADAELTRLRELFEDQQLPAGLVLYDERWHQGVSGILAGRVREAVHRPTVVFAATEEAGQLKGSARSVPGLHIRDVLARIAAAEPEAIERFGGHAMAAGVQLSETQLPAFRKAFTREVERALGEHTVHEIQTDGALAPSELCLATAEALRFGGPWGAGFPEPLFDGEFVVNQSKIVGTHHLKLTVVPAEGGTALQAMVFNADTDLRADPGKHVRLVYRLEVNEYRGRRSPLLVIEHLDRLVSEPAEQDATPA